MFNYQLMWNDTILDDQYFGHELNKGILNMARIWSGFSSTVENVTAFASKKWTFEHLE